MSIPAFVAQWYLPSEVTVFADGEWRKAFEFCEVNSTTIHVITAWNPGNERPSQEINDEQNERLLVDIHAIGLDALEASGSNPESDHAEKSWAVRGLTDKQAVELGRKYGQVAIFRISQLQQTVLSCFDEWSISRDR